MKPKYKNNGGKHGKKNNPRNSKVDLPKRREDNRNSDTVRTSGPVNDVSYYFNNPILKEQLGRVSFNQFTGVPFSMGEALGFNTAVETAANVPYAMRIVTMPSAGYNDGNTINDGISLAALSLYSTLTANNAKNSSYAPQDLTTLILAFGNAISMAGYIQRSLGLAYLYSARNRAYPVGILEAAGIDAEDLFDNIAVYRTRFNTILVAASKIPMLANIPYFAKCSEMYSGVYQDMGGSDMAQTYVFAPGAYWYFKEDYSEEGTGLLSVPFLDPVTNKTTYKLSEVIDVFNMQIQLLLTSSTLNLVYSDILRLAEKQGAQLFQFQPVPDNYVVLPSYVPEIRLWINNCSIMGYPIGDEGYNNTQYNDVYPAIDTNSIMYRPAFKYTSSTCNLDRILNFDFPDVAVDDIIKATRLTAAIKTKWNETEERYIGVATALPDHYVAELVIFRPIGTPMRIANSETSPERQLMLAAFDWAPYLIAMDVTSTPWTVTTTNDLNYYTTVDVDYLKRLHDATYLGLLSLR